MNEGRPTPLYGQVENDVMDYRAARKQALRDGMLTGIEAGRLIRLADVLATRAAALAETDAAIASAIAGRDGVRSIRFLERVRAANPNGKAAA